MVRQRLIGYGRAVGLVAVLAAAPSAITAQPVFTDVTASAGVSYLQHTANDPQDCLFAGFFCEPERMSGGAAVADVDGDGFLDLFVTCLDAPDILFRNRGDGTFEDITASTGLQAFDLQSNGAAFGDVDNDGDPDLYVTVLGGIGDTTNNRYYLFLNDGTGQFSEEAVARGVDVASAAQRRGYSVEFGDYNRDGWIDIHTTEWVPQTFSHSRLLRNLGSGSPGFFEDTTTAAGVWLGAVHGFSSTFTDLDSDGWPDLAVAADFGTSKLFWNNRNGTFTDGTVAAGVGTDENGMGSTFGDFDGDGDLDWFVTSIYDPDQTCETEGCSWDYSGNRLYRNLGARQFSDATDHAGVRDGRWGWGTAFLDYDNDGDLDLVMTNGVDFPAFTVDDAFNTDPMRLWENDGTGVMSEVAVARGITDSGSGKGLVIFDYDNDGDQDLFVVNNAAQPVLYRNDGGNANGWLRVRTKGAVSNGDGLGARVVVTAQAGGSTQLREIGVSTHFLGQSELTAHFGLGLGQAKVASVLVSWPSGLVQGFSNVSRNTTLLADEADCVDVDGDSFCANPDCDDSNAVVYPGAPELCDGLDNDCNDQIDEDPSKCLAGAGAVPDGNAVPGVPLTLSRDAAGFLTLGWGESCSAADDDYEVYEGALGDFTSHEPLTCGTGGATTIIVTPSAGDRYYLVVPRNTTYEGSHGTDGAGFERTPGAPGCLPRASGACQ